MTMTAIEAVGLVNDFLQQPDRLRDVDTLYKVLDAFHQTGQPLDRRLLDQLNAATHPNVPDGYQLRFIDWGGVYRVVVSKKGRGPDEAHMGGQ